MKPESLLLGTLEKSLERYQEPLKKALQTVKDEGVSNYPVLIAYRYEAALGIPLFDRKDYGGDWSFNVSTLEELVTKKLVNPQKVDDFRSLYKEHNKHYCIFLLKEEDAKIVFQPYT